MNRHSTEALERTYNGLMEKISRAMSSRGMLQSPSRHDVGERFIHSVTDMPTLVIFMSVKAHDRNGWYQLFGEIRKSGVYTDINPFMTPYNAGATCDHNSYKVAICIPEEKDILLKNGWVNGNIIVSVPNMDKATALKGLVRAWLVSLIK